MGCITSKDSNGEISPKERLSRKGSVDGRVAHVNSSRVDGGGRSKDRSDFGDAKVNLINRRTRGSHRLYDDHQVEKKNVENRSDQRRKVENGEEAVPKTHPQIELERKMAEINGDDADADADAAVHFCHPPGLGKVPNSLSTEQVAAGWPTWLASAAGEAIRGWVPRRANTFEKLDRIGQGTYSNVYKARDITHDRIVALKKVRFDISDPESVKFMAREILILRRLNHPNIIKLEGLITSQTSSSLYLVLEYMEHDLTGLASLPGMKFTEAQIKCYMQQLFSGLNHCHSHGVLHRDIKGSNLLIDNSGILKIADFGLATFFDPKSSAQLTSRVVTLWYRAPELLLGSPRYGISVDLWSTGCILGELYTGKPILPGRTEVEQLHKIFKLCGSPSEDYWRKTKLPHSSVIKPQRPYRRCVAETYKDFPASALGLMEDLLSMDPALRGTAVSALSSEFFTTKPFACDPSSLPKYPPSKEIDAKLRDEEARRQGAVPSRRSGPICPLAVLPRNGNPELGASAQRAAETRRHSNANRGEPISSHKQQTVSGFLVHPSQHIQATREDRKDFMENQRKKVSHSGPLVQGTGWTKYGKDVSDPHLASGRTNLSIMSGLVATRAAMPDDCQEQPGTSQPEIIKQVSRPHDTSNRSESRTKYVQNPQTQKTDGSPHTGGGKSSTHQPSLHGYGQTGNKIYVSGPLLVPSNNVEQMLKEHNRQIQEFARRRLDKTKVEKMNAQGKQPMHNLMLASRS